MLSFTIQGSIAGFLLAVLVYFLLGEAITTFVTDAQAQKTFRFVLLVICLVIAFAGSLLIKL